ncbi:MAG: hypothetical protein KKF67_00690 [Nanoarchaeota archaeon]|nr:hypothetical protein [Nanoarchaeota archaeon]
MKREEKTRIYLVSYCQNDYQKKRITNFIQSQLGEIVNPDFSERDKNLHLTSTDFNEHLIRQAEQVWVILLRVLYNQFYEGIFQRERLARQLKKPIMHFKINQTGRYTGTAYEVKRKECHPGKNNSSFCSFNEWRKLWRVV